jgi:hypothetical protein
LTKGITVLDAVLWIDISWKETKDSTIINCFRIAALIAKYGIDIQIVRPEMTKFKTLSKSKHGFLFFSLTKGITVLAAVLWIDISWKATKDSTMISCFRIAGFPVVLIIKP